MFTPLSKAQIIGISPNSREIHAYTTLMQHGSILFAFGSEHLVFIYDRQTFKQSIVCTPDTSSPLVAITFFGYGTDCKIICVNSNSIVYVYSMNDLMKPIFSEQIPHKPISITATNDLIFYQTEHSIYSHPATFIPETKEEYERNTFLLTDTNTHQRCLVSPCGRALATFTRGCGYPVIYYSPFKKKRCAILPLQGKISDFQWGVSEHLMAITADDLGSVRLWIESTTSYELHCVKWFHFDSHILSTAICISTDIESQTTQIQSFSRSSDAVFPLFKRHPVLVFAILDRKENNVCFLQEAAGPKLEKIASVTMPLDPAITTICDMRRIFSNHIIKRLISVTRFSRESLSFFQYEIGKNSFTTTAPFSLDFIKSPIVKILKYKIPTTLHKDGSAYDWLKSRPLKNNFNIIELSEFLNGKIAVRSDSIEYYYYVGNENEEKVRKSDVYHLPETVTFATIYLFNDNADAMIVLCNANNIFVLLFDGSEFIEEKVSVESENIRSIAIHSTNLFAISTDKSVDTYIFNNDHYEKFASYEAEYPCATFIPHPFVLIVISCKKSIHFCIIWRNRFIPISEFGKNIPSEKIFPKIRYLTLIDNNVLLAASKSLFVEINIPKNTFPVPYSVNCDYILLTSFSLAFFYPLFERLNGRKLNTKSCDTKMSSESFSFPSDPPDDIPDVLKEVCKSPPPNWGNLDDESQRFLFSWILTRKYPKLVDYIPLFGIWGLLSQDQSVLISSLQINSFQMFCDTLIPIWAKNKNILTKAISVLVTETIPKDEEVEDYLLLCVLLGKISIAKRIARIKSKKKLETFLSSPYLDGIIKNKIDDNNEFAKKEQEKLKRKIEKSAFEAQKKHRYSLSAMFFFLKNMENQAFVILKKSKMMNIIASRLREKKNWPSLLDGILNNFYKNYWNAKIKKDEENVEGQNDKDTFTSITQMAKAKTLTTALFAPADAIESLKNWNFKISDIISIELHRYKILKKFDATHPKDILGLQMTPVFLKAQLDNISNTMKTAELVDSEVEKISTSLSTVTPKKTDLNKVVKNEGNEFDFDFGMNGADFDDFDYEEDEDENDNKNDNDNNNNNDSKNDNDNNNNNDNDNKNDSKNEIENDQKNESNQEKTPISFSIAAVVQAEFVKKDQIKFLNNFSNSFLVPSFETPAFRLFSYNDNFIIYLISCILNNTFNKDTVRYISTIAVNLFYSNEHILFIIAIIYSLSFALSRPSVMLPIFQEPLIIDSCHFFIQQLSDGIYSVPNDSSPCILKNIVSQNLEITESDRLLANFITLHEFCTVISTYYSNLAKQKEEQTLVARNMTSHDLIRNKKNSVTINQFRNSADLDPFHKVLSKNIQKESSKNLKNDINAEINNENIIDESILSDHVDSIFNNGNEFCFTLIGSESSKSVRAGLANYKIISFFHHLHRLNFDNLISTSFSNQSFLQDLVALGISCWDLPDEMTASLIDKKWMMSLDNPFISPFYFADHFQASKSFEIETRLEGKVDGICLDRYDPNFVAICNNEKVEVINILSRKSKISNLNPMNDRMNDSSYLLRYESSNHSLSSLNNNERNSSLDFYLGDNSSSILSSENSYTSMMFDSPFIADHVFKSGEATYVNKFEFFKKRDFNPLWTTDHTSFKEVNATCITAHPTENCFFIGSTSGRIYLASFDVKRNENSPKKKISNIKINATPNNASSSTSQIITSKKSTPSNKNLSIQPQNANHFVKSISMTYQLKGNALPTSTMVPSNSSFGRGSFIVNPSPTQSMTSAFTYSLRTNKMATISSIRNPLDGPSNAHIKFPPLPPSKSMNLQKANSKSYNFNDAAQSMTTTTKLTKASKVAKYTMNSVCFYDGSVTSIKVNMTGDKILTTSDNGYVFLSDFQNSANLFVCSPRVSASWLNSDTQIIVLDPSNSSLLVYDTNAGLQPVSTYKLPQRSYNYCPIDVYGSQVVTGYADGSVVMVDLKNNEFMRSMDVHKSPVSVLKYDESGRFFISGSADNSIKIINAKVEQKPFELFDTFSDYETFGIDASASANVLNEYPAISGLNPTQRGVLNVDITDHTLVACGYSSNIHVWMVTDPFSSIV